MEQPGLDALKSYVTGSFFSLLGIRAMHGCNGSCATFMDAMPKRKQPANDNVCAMHSSSCERHETVEIEQYHISHANHARNTRRSPGLLSLLWPELQSSHLFSLRWQWQSHINAGWTGAEQLSAVHIPYSCWLAFSGPKQMQPL